MFAARDRGVLIFEAFANSPPWFMTMSGRPRYGGKAIQNVVTGQAKQCRPSERCMCLRAYTPIQSRDITNSHRSPLCDIHNHAAPN